MNRHPLFACRVRLFLMALASMSLIISAVGCGGDSSRPVDLPKLRSCKIIVMQEGAALEGAVVTMKSKDASAKYSTCSGVTNASGVAEIGTYGFPGAPAGSYKVFARKTVAEGGKVSTDASGVSSTSGAKEYSMIEAKFTQEASTPLEVEVQDSSKPTEQTVDVGKAVKDFVGMSP